MGKRGIIIATILGLLLLCVGAALVQSVRAGNTRNTAKATQTAQAIGLLDPLRAICSGQSGGAAGAAAFAAGPGVHPVVAFRAMNGGTTFNRDTRVGTGDWSPATLAATQLVACADDAWTTLESCPYKSEKTGSTSTVTRTQNQMKLRLIAAQSGQVVATQTLTGGTPRACQEQETFASGSAGFTLAGEAVTPAAIQGWLRGYVAP